MTGKVCELALHADSVEATAAIAAAVARVAQRGDVIGLIGELGAGKTQFVRGLAEGLGIDAAHVSSPTFVLMQEYDPPDADTDATVLVHIDAYRLQDADELATIGWYDAGEELRDGAVVAVEWADHVRGALEGDWLEVSIAHMDDGRRLTLTPHGNWSVRMNTLRRHLAGADERPEQETR